MMIFICLILMLLSLWLFSTGTDYRRWFYLGHGLVCAVIGVGSLFSNVQLQIIGVIGMASMLACQIVGRFLVETLDRYLQPLDNH